MRPIYTADLVLMPAEESLAGALCDYFRRNREFLTDYMPAWTESFFTERTQLESIRGHMENAKNRTGYRYYIMPKETSLDKGTQRKTTENELPSLTQCTA